MSEAPPSEATASDPAPLTDLRTRLQDGRGLLCGWCTVGHPLVVTALARSGFDLVAIDLQHGAVDARDLHVLLPAAAPLTTLVRIPWNDPAAAMQALDAGAGGVIAPMIRGVSDVRDLVAACRYPPRGIRSYGPTVAALRFGADYAASADGRIVVGAMIETREALAALPEIVQVDGLDLAFVGPADLSQALGGPPGADFREGPVAEALPRIVRTCHDAGVAVGLFCRDPEFAAGALAAGVDLVTADADLAYLRSGAAAAVAEVRAGVSG